MKKKKYKKSQRNKDIAAKKKCNIQEEREKEKERNIVNKERKEDIQGKRKWKE